MTNIGNVEHLFIRMMEDLENKTESHDDYEVLGISKILRQLLLDKAPLAPKVNRVYKEKISYTVTEFKLPPPLGGLQFYSMEDSINPDLDTGRNRPKITVKVDKLLEAPIMIIRGDIFTIKDVINHAAHVLGGVHTGDPENDREKALNELSKIFFIGGLPAGVRILRAIGKVVHKGLLPLKERIEQQ